MLKKPCFAFSQPMEHKSMLKGWVEWFESRGQNCEIREEIHKVKGQPGREIKRYVLWLEGEDAFNRAWKSYQNARPDKKPA